MTETFNVHYSAIMSFQNRMKEHGRNKNHKCKIQLFVKEMDVASGRTQAKLGRWLSRSPPTPWQEKTAAFLMWSFSGGL